MLSYLKQNKMIRKTWNKPAFIIVYFKIHVIPIPIDPVTTIKATYNIKNKKKHNLFYNNHRYKNDFTNQIYKQYGHNSAK